MNRGWVNAVPTGGAIATLLVNWRDDVSANFYVAPTEETAVMGARSTHLYFPRWASAWAGEMDAFLVCFSGQSPVHLEAPCKKYDWLGVAAAEVGLVLTTVVLITGPIWAQARRGAYGGPGTRA